MTRRIPRPSIPAAIAIGVAILSLGVVAGSLLVPVKAPLSIAPTARATSVMAKEVRTVDEQNATLTITSTPSQDLISRTAGIVTRSECLPGTSLSSGSGGVSVNNATLIALATSQPLWRDLSAGDSGADVRSLQQELARLGYTTSVDGRFGASTLRAVVRLAQDAGADDARAWATFPFARFVWLPAPDVSVATCEAAVGAEIGSQGTIATLPQGIAAAKVSPLPANAMVGKRVIVAGDLTLPVDASGSIGSVEDLNRLAASAAYREHIQARTQPAESPGGSIDPPSPGGLSVQYRLAEPATVFAVPAAAVYAVHADEGCLVSRGQPRVVAIAGSQLGETFVVPRTAEKIGSVDLDTRKAPPCR